MMQTSIFLIERSIIQHSIVTSLCQSQGSNFPTILLDRQRACWISSRKREYNSSCLKVVRIDLNRLWTGRRSCWARTGNGRSGYQAALPTKQAFLCAVPMGSKGQNVEESRFFYKSNFSCKGYGGNFRLFELIIFLNLLKHTRACKGDNFQTNSIVT